MCNRILLVCLLWSHVHCGKRIAAPLPQANPICQKNVFELYNLTPSALFRHGKYKFRMNSQGQWLPIPRYEYATPHLLLDIPNGYMRIGDSGTGGGYVQEDFAIFRSTGANCLIALAHFSHQEETLAQRSGIKIISLQGASFTDVTEKVLPPLSPTMFFTKSDGLKCISRITDGKPVYKYIDLVYTLPRKGTDVHVDLARQSLRGMMTLVYVDEKDPCDKIVNEGYQVKEYILEWRPELEVFHVKTIVYNRR